MTKFTLEVEPDLDFDLIGICSNHSDYRLTWSLNATLGIDLTKNTDNFQVSGKKGQIVGTFSLYEFIHPETHTEYYLIKNKNNNETLIPAKPQLDYFLVIRENFDLDLDELLARVKMVPSVQTAFSFYPEELKSASNFIF